MFAEPGRCGWSAVGREVLETGGLGGVAVAGHRHEVAGTGELLRGSPRTDGEGGSHGGSRRPTSMTVARKQPFVLTFDQENSSDFAPVVRHRKQRASAARRGVHSTAWPKHLRRGSIDPAGRARVDTAEQARIACDLESLLDEHPLIAEYGGA